MRYYKWYHIRPLAVRYGTSSISLSCSLFLIMLSLLSPSSQSFHHHHHASVISSPLYITSIVLTTTTSSFFSDQLTHTTTTMLLPLRSHDHASLFFSDPTTTTILTSSSINSNLITTMSPPYSLEREREREREREGVVLQKCPCTLKGITKNAIDVIFMGKKIGFVYHYSIICMALPNIFLLKKSKLCNEKCH